MTSADSVDKLAVLPAPGGLPAEPENGWVGRAEELQAVESVLNDPARRGAVLVCGYEGLGKTTLVAHAARDLVRTGRYEHAVYTRLLGGNGSEVALYDLGRRLLGREWNLADKDAEERVMRARGEKPTLILWDHLETLLTGENVLKDKNLAAYYDKIRLITRGPLFTRERWKAIVNMNLGRYDYLIDWEYYKSRLPDPSALS